MKKIFSLLFIFVLLISLCGCNKNTISNNDSEFQSGLTDIPTGNTTDSAGNSENVKDENNETVNDEPTIENSELTEEQKAEQERMNQIADCKNYVSDIKVYFCDYSVFDYKTAVSLEYISPALVAQEKGCSVVMVVDYGSKELKEKYNPRFSFSVPNISKKNDTDGVISTTNYWNISDTVTVYSHKFSHIIDIKDMTYGLNCTDFDVRLRCNIESEPMGFEDILSILTSDINSVKIIDDRAYMIVLKNSDIEVKTSNDVDKYFIDDMYVYIPLTKGSEITLSMANVD